MQKKILNQIVIFLGLLFFSFSASASNLNPPLGKIFVKDTLSTGTHNGSSWENAFGSLYDAFAVANAGDSIFVSKGVYDPDNLNSGDRTASFIIPSGVILKGSFPLSLTGTQTTGSDLSTHPSFLSGEINVPALISDNSHHIIITENSNGFTIDGFNILKGNAVGATDSTGGAWLNKTPKTNAIFYFKNCFFSNNKASHGGSISNIVSTENVNIYLDKVNFSGDTALNNGGSIYSMALGGSTKISMKGGNIFNSVALINGGAIYNKADGGDAHLDLEKMVLAYNSAVSNGGAIYNEAIRDSSYVEMDTVIIGANKSENGAGFYNMVSLGGKSSPISRSGNYGQNKASNSGGGFLNSSTNSGSVASPVFRNTYFVLDSAAHGGAIYNFALESSESSPKVFNCHFQWNKAMENGGVFYSAAINSAEAKIKLESSILYDNYGDLGGALYLFAGGNGDASPTLRNVTFVKDSAKTNGGVMYARAVLQGTINPQIENTIMWNNKAVTMGKEFYLDSVTVDISYSLVESANIAAMNVGVNTNVVNGGTGMIFAKDPLLFDSAIPLPTPCSPAINAGNAIAQSENDFFNTPRPYPSTMVDIGALEFYGILSTNSSLVVNTDISSGNHALYGNPSVTISNEISGGTVGLGAKNFILFEQGFQVDQGTVFSAEIAELNCPD